MSTPPSLGAGGGGGGGGGGGAGGGAAVTPPTSTWESHAPEALDEEEDFSLGEAAPLPAPKATAAATGMSGTPQPPAPLTSLRSGSALPPGPQLTRTLSSRRRAALVGGGSDTPTSAPTSPSAHIQVFQTLTGAAGLLGAQSPAYAAPGAPLAGLDKHLIRKMRDLDIWGTRSQAEGGGGNLHTVTELRQTCHEMAHAFAASVLHSVHTEDFPVLTPRAAAGGAGAPAPRCCGGRGRPPPPCCHHHCARGHLPGDV